MTPAASVVIPTYNQPALLLATLESVFAQTFDDYEVVVVNDGSTDDTLDRLAPLIERHGDRLRVITQVNGGVGAARNRGMDEARGKYIALLDHDDLWLPDKLRTQIEFLQGHPEACAAVVPFATSNHPWQMLLDPAGLVDANGYVDRPFRKLADKSPLMMTCSVLVFDRRKRAGLRFATLRGAIEDVPFQIGLLSRGPLGIAGDRILAVYRLYEGNTSASAHYFREGLRLLREMDARGEFAQLEGPDRADLHAWLAFISRAAAVKQLMEGRRWESLKTYVSEFKHQARDRHLKYLAAFPVLALGPAAWLKRWRGKE